MSQGTKTMWVTKRLLTEGVRQVECWPTSSKPYVRTAGRWAEILKIGVDAHETEADALTEAERQRAKKIASLEKQIQRLRAMKFSGA